MPELPTVGARAEATHTFTPADVAAFADLSGDHNPVHLDAAYAASTRFGKPIVHGMLVSSLFSRLLAEELPGPGTIYIAQDLTFRRPVFVGQTVLAAVDVLSADAETRRVVLATTVVTDEGKACLTGTATVLVDG